MTTNFIELLPQQRGALVVNAQINRLPDGSPEQEELIKIRNAGIEVGDMIRNACPVNEFPAQGGLNSRKKGRLSSERYAAKIAEQMVEGGKTLQEINAVVVGILGARSEVQL